MDLSISRCIPPTNRNGRRDYRFVYNTRRISSYASLSSHYAAPYGLSQPSSAKEDEPNDKFLVPDINEDDFAGTLIYRSTRKAHVAAKVINASQTHSEYYLHTTFCTHATRRNAYITVNQEAFHGRYRLPFNQLATRPTTWRGLQRKSFLR